MAKKTVGDIMKNMLTFITQASLGNHKMQTALGRQKVTMTQRFLVLSVETGDENAALYCVLPLRERRIKQKAVFCEERFGKIHTLYVHFTYKDVDRFQSRSVHELYNLKWCYDQILTP